MPAALAKGRHKTDSENYRGLGYRTDAKARSFVELSMLSRKSDGITHLLLTWRLRNTTQNKQRWMSRKLRRLERKIVGRDRCVRDSVAGRG